MSPGVDDGSIGEPGELDGVDGILEGSAGAAGFELPAGAGSESMPPPVGAAGLGPLAGAGSERVPPPV